MKCACQHSGTTLLYLLAPAISNMTLAYQLYIQSSQCASVQAGALIWLQTVHRTEQTFGNPVK